MRVPVGLGVESPVETMAASDDFEAFLTSFGIAPSLASQMVADGWQSANFASIVSDVSDFDRLNLWEQLFPEEINLVQRSSVKAAWFSLQSGSKGADALPSSSQPSVVPSAVEGSWTESFPPKINVSTVSKLKKQFLEDYPSEVLSPETMPSSRLISLAYQQQQRGEHRWIPWKYRMTQSKMDDMVIYQKQKIPKLEGVQLHSLLIDEPPTIDISNSGMGINAIRSIFEVHNLAVSLVGSCHLQRLKAYTLKFMGLLTQRQDSDSNLRNANILEAQAADKQLWQIIHDLVTDSNFTLDDALHEVTQYRSDMQSLLQPRPKTASRQPPSQQIGKDGKGKDGKGKDGKGKDGKGKGKRQDVSGKPTWVTEANINGKKVQLCMMFQNNSCQRGDQCKFGHYCAYPLANGQACGQKHSAFSHQQQSHWLESELQASDVHLFEVHEDTQPSSSAALTDAILEDPTVATAVSPSDVSHSSLLNSTPHDWKWPEFPRIFLDICSGAGYPLSKAMLESGCACFAVDILLSPTMDILDNSFFEPLLRVCASGIVAYGAGAPNCGEYSRLKLRPGGPPALRTPQSLQGLPNLSPAQLSKVQSSFELMVRLVICLELVYSAGGHVHLEQPTNSMAWLEKDVARLIKFCAPHLVNFAACAYGMNWQKSWLLACSYISMTSLGTKCEHGINAHEIIAGQSADGSFRSRKTSEYPQAMCSAIARLISPLCISKGTLVDLQAALTLIPKKGLTDFPISYEDGGGLHSQPDWSRPYRQEENMFQHLRKSWIDRIFDQRLHLKFLRFLQAADSSPPFSDEDIQPFRDILSQFLTERGCTASWEIREDQPLHLSILQQLSYFMHDADRTLFPCLQDGVSTGFDKDIPPSSCFPAASNSMENAMPLSVHLTNWQSAENDLETTRHLVQQELDKGWVYKYPGTLADAQVEFGEKLSVGRLGLALSDNRPPRLVVDSSICGLNSQVGLSASKFGWISFGILIGREISTQIGCSA